MAEAASAPAAPVASPANGAAPSNGVPANAGGQPAAKVAPVRPTVPQSSRAADGRFVPKDPAGDAGAATPAPKEEPWRYKDTLNVFGEKEEVDFDRETVKRNLQKLRAYEKKHLPEMQQSDARARRILELAKTDPDAFLRELGQDPKAYARKMLAEEARLGAMTEEEKAIFERDQKIAAFEAKEKERTESEAKQKKEATHARVVGEMRAKVGAALKAVVPQLGDNYEAMSAVVDAFKLQLQDGAGLAGIDPNELARDAINLRHTQMRTWASSMDGATLAKELGPKAVEALLEHSLADFDKSQGFDGPSEPDIAPAPRNDGPREYLTAADVAANLRKLSGGRR